MPGRPGLELAPWPAPKPLCPAAPLMWDPPATPMPPAGICANSAGVTPNNAKTNAERSACFMIVPRMWKASCSLARLNQDFTPLVYTVPAQGPSTRAHFTSFNSRSLRMTVQKHLPSRHLLFQFQHFYLFTSTVSTLLLLRLRRARP